MLRQEVSDWPIITAGCLCSSASLDFYDLKMKCWYFCNTKQNKKILAVGMTCMRYFVYWLFPGCTVKIWTFYHGHYVVNNNIYIFFQNTLQMIQNNAPFFVYHMSKIIWMTNVLIFRTLVIYCIMSCRKTMKHSNASVFF